MFIFAEVVGVIGVMMTLGIYALLQFQKVRHHAISYSMVNLIGSLCILFSLFFAWNLPAALMEISWGVVSLYGLVKAYQWRDKMRRGDQRDE